LHVDNRMKYTQVDERHPFVDSITHSVPLHPRRLPLAILTTSFTNL
jgi:hypothetical protein